MEYKDCKKIYQGISWYGNSSLIITLASIASRYPMFTKVSFLNLSLLSFILFIYNRFFDMTNCTEYKELNEIYKEIQKDILLNKDTLEIKRVAEIYAYFLFLLREGYLSYDLNYRTTGLEVFFDEDAIALARCLNNHGCCRHKAPFLKEMYVQSNIESTTFIVHPENCKEFHVITVANEDGVTYLLDPEWEDVFYKGEDNRYHSECICFRHYLKTDLKALSYYKPMSMGEGDAFLRSMSETYKKMMANRDIFKKFHRENKEKLEEAERIYQKLLKNN